MSDENEGKILNRELCMGGSSNTGILDQQARWLAARICDMFESVLADPGSRTWEYIHGWDVIGGPIPNSLYDMVTNTERRLGIHWPDSKDNADLMSLARWLSQRLVFPIFESIKVGRGHPYPSIRFDDRYSNETKTRQAAMLASWLALMDPEFAGYVRDKFSMSTEGSYIKEMEQVLIWRLCDVRAETQNFIEAKIHNHEGPISALLR